MTLLLGNGINQLETTAMTWRQVLEEAAEFAGCPNAMQGWKQKPLPLVYEEIFGAYVSNFTKAEIVLKKFVADRVGKISSNWAHRELIVKRPENVLTTNYDYAIEEASDEKWEKRNVHRETKYSRFRRNTVRDTNIWHIHGVHDAPNTIQLGYEHYGGQLHYLRDLVVGFKKTKEPTKKSAFLQYGSTFGALGEPNSWLDLFFRDDVHIVGLTLDFAEIDLWWAIAYKYRLTKGQVRREGMKRELSKNVGKTYYHALEPKYTDKNSKGFMKVLPALGVKVVTHDLERGYKGMYKDVFKEVL